MRKVLNRKGLLIISILFISFIFSNLMPKVTLGSDNDIYVNARSAIAMDSNTGIVLYEKNSREIIPMASTTKIMTTLVAIKYGNLEKKIKISKRASGIHGSQVGYKAEEEVGLKELLYGLMLRSGNDAAIAIAEGVAGSVDEFLKLMNEYAMELGLRDTHFESPHGLDSDNHYTTAYDLALLTTKAKKYKLFNDIVGAKVVDAKEYGFTRSYNNINKILYRLPEANGVKTGYTGNAGKCLVSSVNLNGNDIVIVTLNCTPRWKETEKIYNYVKKTYTYKNMIHKDEEIATIRFPNSEDEGKLICKKDIIIPQSNTDSYSTKVVLPKYEIEAPIKSGTQIGHICIIKNEETILKEPLVCKNSIKKNNSLMRKLKDLKFIKWLTD